ncbi:MAG: DMT family transporter [Arcticibacter sp.]
MSFSSRNRNLLILHGTVLVWGFTGILGSLISIPSVPLVWYRVLIAFITLYVYFKATKTSLALPREALIKLFLTGALVGGHWILFFQSIKSSTISVGLVCLSSLTLFTAILEPLIGRKKISGLEILTGVFIICGIVMIFKFESQYTLGISLGLGSAFLASLFSIINSRQVQKHPASLISFYEMIGAFIWLSIYMFATGGFDSGLKLVASDFIYLMLLGTVCTSLAYVAGVSVMRELSAFRVALITNLEPVYGIVLAFIFFGSREHMTLGFYAGATMIMGAIFLYPYLRNKIEKRRLEKTIPLV